jgi:GNAT superfamily N-acetyltransferase
VSVRLAAPLDVSRLAPIEVAAGARFRDVGMDAVADDPPPPPEVYAEAIRLGHLWGAELDPPVEGVDVRVGYAWALVLDADGRSTAGRRDDPPGQHHLEQISVVPEAGGLGVGAALMATVIGWARDDGGESLTLSTFRDLRFNAPWYARFGFDVVPAGEVESDPRWRELRRHEAAAGLDVEARVVMRLRLQD